MAKCTERHRAEHACRVDWRFKYYWFVQQCVYCAVRTGYLYM